MRIFVLLLVILSVPARPAFVQSSAPLCDNWSLHTRTRPEICPEVLVRGLTTHGAASIWNLAFDARNNLYFTRPAPSEIWRMEVRAGQQESRFGPPERYKAGYTVFHEIGWLFGLIHADKPLSRGFVWSADGVLWTVVGTDQIKSGRGEVITLREGSNPASITFYRGTAFPWLHNHLLIVTAGSWNGPVIEGYELLAVPIDPTGKPGKPISLIPANVGDRTSSDASLAELTFFPDHPVAVAVDNNGWIYIAVREGMIVRLRPRVG